MNYKETALSGTSWMRCRTVTITNPLPGHGPKHFVTGVAEGPCAVFREEKVISIGGEQTTVEAGSCKCAFSPGASIALLDPSTGDPTGATVTHAELYAVLYSLYIQTATARDAA